MVVIDKDLGFNRIMRSLEALDGTEIDAGIFSNAGSDSRGTPYVDIALYNEFGTYRIPARPAVRIASDENQRNWGDIIEAEVGTIIGGGGGKAQMCKRVGKQMVKDIQSIFGDTSKLAPNAPSTIKRKGRNEPLIDTGTLRSKVSYRVED